MGTKLERRIPNPNSTILQRAVVAGAGIGAPPDIDPPQGMAVVVLYVPDDLIVGHTLPDIQADLGLPWHAEDTPGGVFIDDLIEASSSSG